MSIPVDDSTALSRLFHLNSEPWLNEQAYRGSPYVQEARSYPDAPRTALPRTDPGWVGRLATRRRSVRAFRDLEMPLSILAGILRTTYGATGPDPLAGGGRFLRRSVPSAGGLYPLELYLLARRVEGLATGCYHFDAVGEALETLWTRPWKERAAEIFYTWPFVESAPVIVCLAADFVRIQKKYGPRGYRYALLEAGHAMQNLVLAAEEAGFSTLCMGGYRDAALNRLLGLSPPEEGVVYTVAIGRAVE